MSTFDATALSQGYNYCDQPTHSYDAELFHQALIEHAVYSLAMFSFQLLRMAFKTYGSVKSLQPCKRKGPNWPFFHFSGSHL